MKLILKILVSVILLTIIVVGLLAVYINWFDAPSYNVDIKPIHIESTDSQIAIGEKIALNYCVSCHLSSSGTLSGKIMIEHPKWGTITSPKPLVCFKILMLNKFAEAPELTNTLCFTPNHLDHSASNVLTKS